MVSWKKLITPPGKSPKDIKEWLGLITDAIKGIKGSENWYDDVTLLTSDNIVNDLETGGVNKALSSEQGKLLNQDIHKVATRQYIPIDYFGEDMVSIQKCFDYCNENGYGILIPNKNFNITQPIILKEHGTYYIKGCNTNINDSSKIKSKCCITPSSILFKGELTDNNTTVYLTMENVRILPVKGDDGYTKNGTYIFYNLNLYGLVLNNVTVRHIDIFCRGYISKASVINNSRISFIKTAFLQGNEYNMCFMADSQITNSYITGAYPVTLFQGISVNSTVSNCFIDYFKYMQNCNNFMNNNFKFKDCIIGVFYRWYEGDIARGKIIIEDNKIDNVKNSSLIEASQTNFVNIDEDMRSGVAGVFANCQFIENIYERKTDKSIIHGNSFTECDNVFTKSNGIMQVSIKDNYHTNVSGLVYDLSFRDTSNGLNKYGEFYCDALDKKIVCELPMIRSGNIVYCFESQKCILDGIEYTMIDEKWVATSYLNYYQTDEIIVGKYLNKNLYRKVLTGTLTVETSGFKNINIPEAENLFFISDLSYWGNNKIQFNNIPKTGVFTDSICCITWVNSDLKRLILYNNGGTTPITFHYSITIEYTKVSDSSISS